MKRNPFVLKLEKEFDEFYNSIGFKRVTDKLGNGIEFSNADYYHEENKIVIELKIIDKDFFQNGGTIDRLNTFVTVPINVDENGIGQYTFSLPEKNREGKHDSIEEPLRRILKKAGKQLKETNKVLFDSRGACFIMIALNMNTSIDPAAISLLVSQLGAEFSALHGFMICTPTWHSQPPICYFGTRYDCPEHAVEFCDKIGAQWITFAENEGHI